MNWGLGLEPQSFDFKYELFEDIKLVPSFKITGKSTVTRARFSPDGSKLAFVDTVGVLRVLDLEKTKIIHQQRIRTCRIDDFCWEVSNKFLFIAGNDQHCACVALESGGKLLEEHKEEVGNDSIIAVVRHCDSATQGAALKNDPSVVQGKSIYENLWNSFLTVASPKSYVGQFFLTAGFNGIVKKWDVRKFAEIQSVRVHDKMITSLEFSEDDRVCLSAGYDGYARLFDARDLSFFITFDNNSPVSHSFFVENTKLVLISLDTPGIRGRICSLTQPDKFVPLLVPDEGFFRQERGANLSTPLTGISKNISHVSSTGQHISGETFFFLKCNDGLMQGIKPGPFANGCTWRNAVAVPSYKSISHDENLSGYCSVHFWDFNTGYFKGSITADLHQQCAITSVDSRKRFNTDFDLLATSSVWPDCSVIIWAPYQK